MKNLTIKIEPDENGEKDDPNVKEIKTEPEAAEIITSCIEIEEHPVKLEDEEEQCHMLFSDLPEPNTEVSANEKPQGEEEQCHMLFSDLLPAPNTEVSVNEKPQGHRSNLIPSLAKSNDNKCEPCCKSFESRKQLNRHILAVHGKRKHCCGACGKEFTLLENLKTHLITHLKNPMYKCSECHTKFRSRYFLYLHIKRIHPKAKCICNVSLRVKRGNI